MLDGLVTMIRSCILKHQPTYLFIEKLVLWNSLLHELLSSILFFYFLFGNRFQCKIFTNLMRDVKNLNYFVRWECNTHLSYNEGEYLICSTHLTDSMLELELVH